MRRAGDGTPLTASPLVLALMMVGFLTQLLPLTAYALADRSFGRVNLAVKVALSTAAIFAVTMLAPSGVAPFIYFQF